MRFFQDIKIGTKLFIGFFVMMLFLIVTGIQGFLSSQTIHNSLKDILSSHMPSLDYLLQADRDLHQLMVAERSMIFSNPQKPEFNDMVKDYEENLKQAETRFDKYKALATTKEEMILIGRYEAARKEWMVISRQIVDGLATDTREGRRLALDLSLSEGKEKFEVMRGYLDKLTEVNETLAHAAQNEAETSYRRIWKRQGLLQTKL